MDDTTETLSAALSMLLYGECLPPSLERGRQESEDANDYWMLDEILFVETAVEGLFIRNASDPECAADGKCASDAGRMQLGWPFSPVTPDRKDATPADGLFLAPTPPPAPPLPKATPTDTTKVVMPESLFIRSDLSDDWVVA